MRSKKILYIVDSLDYVKNNCFQSQLLNAFNYCNQIDVLELFPLLLLPFRLRRIDLDKYDKLISVLRLRTLSENYPRLERWLNGRSLTIYDQDPWENYIDTSPIKGIYQRLNSNSMIDSVYVTSPWWAKKLNGDGINSFFVRMGMEPVYCDIGPEFNDRITFLGFRGALHEHRKIVFDQLRNYGLQIDIGQGRLSYQNYLEYLQTLKFFIHDESQLPWICDGEEISRSTGMWIKSVETAARGTFCLRNYHPEGKAYNLSKIPLIRCYSDLKQVPEIIEEIQSMPMKKIRDIQQESVAQITSQLDWINSAILIANGV
jgi:hypothetical protein